MAGSVLDCGGQGPGAWREADLWKHKSQGCENCSGSREKGGAKGWKQVGQRPQEVASGSDVQGEEQFTS